MKRLLFSLSLFSFIYSAQSQIIFQEDFDGIGGPTAGGAGTYTFPAGWTKANVDNRTPAASVSYVNEAWERREDFQTNVTDSVSFSTSWYSPAGAADDWMWTPVIGPLPANCTLSWNAKAYDPAYPDGYEVRIMTTAPTGGTGTLGNQVSNSTVLYSTGAEATTWTARSVSLNSYAGQSVYIGFRNNSTDKFLLVIDDITVQVQVNADAQLLSVDTVSEYTMIPVTQTTALPLNGTIRNNGIASMTNVALNVNIFNSANANVYSASSAPATLAAGASSSFTVAPFTPAAVDNYTVRYSVSSTQTDQVAGNDTASWQFSVTDSTYARDNGVINGGLGIGAGNGGYLGQSFEVVNADDLTSIGIYYTLGYTGKKLAVAVWNMSGGVPTTMVGGTDTLLYPDDSARFYVLPIHGGLLHLTAGSYAVTGIEFDSTLSIGLTSSIFTTNTTFVNWPTSPFGTWAHNEAFGASFAKSYVIRPNFGCALTATVATSADPGCHGTADGSASINAANGSGIISYSWNPSVSTGASANNLPAGTYSVTATDASGCVATTSFTLTDPAAITSSQSYTLCAGNTVTVGSHVYSTTGVYTDTLSAMGGCDSIVTTNLTVNPVDVATAVAGSTITANASAGTSTFLWVDCDNNNAVIPGETNQSFTPSVSGNYAVIVTTSGCTDTSACSSISLVGIAQQAASTDAFSVYPNPSNGAFSVKSRTEGVYTIYNELGQSIRTVELNAKNNYSVTINDLNSGVYTISGITAGKVVKQKLVIRK